MSRAPTAAALAAHRAACERGEPGYTDPDTGLFVMTSRFLRERGHCCGQACRHCPWPAEVRRRAGRPAGAPAWPRPEDSGE